MPGKKKCDPTPLAIPMHGKEVLGKFESNGNNIHKVPSSERFLMKSGRSLSWRSIAANCIPYWALNIWAGEVPLIR